MKEIESLFQELQKAETDCWEAERDYLEFKFHFDLARASYFSQSPYAEIAERLHALYLHENQYQYKELHSYELGFKRAKFHLTITKQKWDLLKLKVQR